jgi:hypothetical protein
VECSACYSKRWSNKSQTTATKLPREIRIAKS